MPLTSKHRLHISFAAILLAVPHSISISLPRLISFIDEVEVSHLASSSILATFRHRGYPSGYPEIANSDRMSICFLSQLYLPRYPFAVTNHISFVIHTVIPFCDMLPSSHPAPFTHNSNSNYNCSHLILHA